MGPAHDRNVVLCTAFMGIAMAPVCKFWVDYNDWTKPSFDKQKHSLDESIDS